MENESAQEKAARRRARRMQHLIPDEALRRSPRIRRSGAPPFYGPAPRRTSREASLATDDDASSVASSGSRRSRSSRRSSRASEMLNESGQVLYEGSESEADQDVTVVSSTRYAAAYVRHRVAYQAQQVDQALGQLVRSPRSLNSGDSGVASGNEWVARSAAGEAAQQRRSEDHLVEGGVEEDLPPHVFGLDSDGEVDGTQDAQYRFKKERILLPPPPSPGALAALLLFIKRVASFPYLCLVSLLTFDLLLLERLSLLLAITTNPVQKKKSWFGLLVLLLALLGLTWWLTVIAVATPLPSGCANCGLSTEDLETFRHSVLSEMRVSSAVSRAELLQWLQGNLTQLRETQDRLVTDLVRVEGSSDTRLSAVSARVDQHDVALAGVSAVTKRLEALVRQLDGLEHQVDLLKDSNQSTHTHLKQLQVDVSGALNRGQQIERDLADLRSTCCGERVTAEEVPTLVHQELGKMLDKDGGGVFGTWLQTQMVGVVRQEDFNKFNASLRGLIIKWIEQEGGLSQPKVEEMILEALRLYDADRTGKFDYALETAGGSIPHALCSETYTPSASTVQLFGYTVWQYSNSARTIIQPGVLPGQCWAFAGDQGYVVIKLAAGISLTEVTVEHLPRSLSATGKIDSAPKNFSLYVGESEEERQFVGDYVYSGNDPRETIPVKACNRVVRYVEFRFHSNHGNKNYTCVYRLRVHGHLPTSTEGQS